MSPRRRATAATSVSLGLSLTLAAVLLAMATAAEPARPFDPVERLAVEADEPVAAPRQPDLGVVVLPPPPQPSAPEQSTPQPETETAAPPPAPAAEPPPAVAVVEPAAIAEAAPAPPLEAEPQPPVAVPPSPASPPVEITPAAIREGRTLLRLLERGEGPDIEIAWPAAAGERSDLYRLFNRCLGMRTVVMSSDGAMFDADGGRLAANAFDADRYSGFVRQPAGGLSAGERAQVDAIRRRHGLAGGQVLRLFPRRVDAILLGALHHIAGDAFANGVRIRARYRAGGDGVQIFAIDVDGQATGETIVLPYTAQRTCRSGGPL